MPVPNYLRASAWPELSNDRLVMVRTRFHSIRRVDVHRAGDGNLDGSDGEAIRNSAGSDNPAASHSSHVGVHGGAEVMVGVGKRTTSKARGHLVILGTKQSIR